jgi:hypothetical protein
MTPTRYLTFWEFPVEDIDRAIIKWNKFIESSKKMPLKFPKFVFPPIGAGKLNEGIAIVEVENEEQLTNYLLFVSPEFKLRFVPILEATKTFEVYNKTKEEMKVELR